MIHDDMGKPEIVPPEIPKEIGDIIRQYGDIIITYKKIIDIWSTPPTLMVYEEPEK